MQLDRGRDGNKTVAPTSFVLTSELREARLGVYGCGKRRTDSCHREPTLVRVVITSFVPVASSISSWIRVSRFLSHLYVELLCQAAPLLSKAMSSCFLGS